MSTRQVVARPAAGRDIAAADFADITSTPVQSIDWAAGGALVVRFEVAITDAEAAAVVRRVVSATVEEEQLRTELAGRLAAGPDGEDLGGWLVLVTRLALCLGTGQTPEGATP